MSVVYYLGAKPDTPDRRDHRKVYSQAEIPSSPNVDLRQYVDHVYDQGQLASCTANALCGAYGLDLKKQSQTLLGDYYYFDSSRLFLYYNTREYEGTAYYDSGASIRDTVKALNRQGVCTESDWPYDVRKFDEKPPKRCYDAAKGNTLCKYERLGQDIDQLRACLKDNCPFVFGFKMYNSFTSESNGEIPMPTNSERAHDPVGIRRHAVMAVGYDDRRRRIVILNSWGSSWGDNGYFYMPYHFIMDRGMCFDFWKISFACERGKPRPKNTATFSDTSTGSSGACGYGSYSVPNKRGWY